MADLFWQDRFPEEGVFRRPRALNEPLITPRAPSEERTDFHLALPGALS